ncbi:hypothetical protein [Komagataeibacter xylinus]|uniref:Uncharacterized protein n=1 Tax=Komagataeibacter xylinus TaxID=28448 RepID=A0A857FPB4_KOMXY|nr:hypothetical protein [Komagataeibacter xylinus]QHC35359.1 hypothetical protein FMA36_07465 [Komagataeibacter xylinus]
MQVSGEQTVRFTRSWQCYNRGVEAGFNPARAAMLVKLGVGVIINDGRRPATDVSHKTPARGVVRKG